MAAAAGVLGALALALPLGAATSAVSISAQPPVVQATIGVHLFGRVANSVPGQTVQLEMSECNGYGWRVLTHVQTTGLGAWQSDADPNVTTKYRARWRSSTSNVVTVRARPFIFTDNHHHQRLLVQVRANDEFRHAVLQRRAGKRWVLVRTFALGNGPFASGADLKVRLPRGTRVRILMTQAQVGRCYLPAQTTTVVT